MLLPLAALDEGESNCLDTEYNATVATVPQYSAS
jgi:hypothetical protein